MAITDKKLAQVKIEDIMKHAKANGNVRWLKAKAEEVEKMDGSRMKKFATLRRAYLAEFLPAMLVRKKKPVKKADDMFKKIRNMEE